MAERGAEQELHRAEVLTPQMRDSAHIRSLTISQTQADVREIIT